MKIIGVIPSRYKSTRFPGKPLALIKGTYLVELVWRQAMESKSLDDVLIATDDKRIFDAARNFGAKVVMTSDKCKSGTDRLAEAAKKISGNIFVNIQGDEPLINPSTINKLVYAMKEDKNIAVATAAYEIKNSDDINNPNVVKVVFDENKFALYFSRSRIPYNRGVQGMDVTAKPTTPLSLPCTMHHAPCTTYYKHLGLYGYRRDFLLEIANWKQTTLEKTEMLEQLRILEKGFKIKVVMSDTDSIGVDVPEDIRKIHKICLRRKVG